MSKTLERPTYTVLTAAKPIAADQNPNLKTYSKPCGHVREY